MYMHVLWMIVSLGLLVYSLHGPTVHASTCIVKRTFHCPFREADSSPNTAQDRPLPLGFRDALWARAAAGRAPAVTPIQKPRRDLAQGFSPISWVNTRGKQPPCCLVSGSGAFRWYLRITAQCEHSLAALESIAVPPVAAAFRRNQQVKAATKGDLPRIANDTASDTRFAKARVETWR